MTTPIFISFIFIIAVGYICQSYLKLNKEADWKGAVRGWFAWRPVLANNRKWVWLRKIYRLPCYNTNALGETKASWWEYLPPENVRRVEKTRKWRRSR